MVYLIYDKHIACVFALLLYAIVLMMNKTAVGGTHVVYFVERINPCIRVATPST